MRRVFVATLIIVMLLAGSPGAVAANYIIDLTHSHILFMVDHLGFAKMVGLFANFSGTFSLDPEKSKQIGHHDQDR
jgi:polyisoprenoid-binding protein YceI